MKVSATAFASFLLFSAPAFAESITCTENITKLKEAMTASKDVTWTDASHNEWEVLRGIYLLNPKTPKGWPLGDRAAVISGLLPGTAVVLFIDGDSGCTMLLPSEIMDTLAHVDDVQPHPVTK